MKILKTFLFAIALVSLSACGNDDDGTPVVPIVETFTVSLSTDNEIPAVPGRSETGTAVLEILEDNTLRFTITVSNLDANDTLTAAHIHTGNLVETGGILVGLVNGTDISFNGNVATGTIELSATNIAAVQGDNVYVNVHSENEPDGLVRGQVDKTIVLAKNVALLPANEVPVVSGRNETGTAFIRLDSENTLYYRVQVANLDTADTITMGHIHTGEAGVNGDVLINLGITSDNLDTPLSIDLSTAQALSLQTPTYINIHSMQEANGLLRGQLTE